MKKTKEKGITLIALIITIIVLLILAGVSINLVLGDNGVITKAKTAVEETEKAKVDEQRKLAISQANMNFENTEYIDSNGVTVIIPAGFAPTEIDGEDTVENGLVITDGYGNEFVWIPASSESYSYIKYSGSSNYEIGVNSTDDAVRILVDDYGTDFFIQTNEEESLVVNTAKGFWVSRYEMGIDNIERENGVAQTSDDWITMKSQQGLEPIRNIKQKEALELANNWLVNSSVQSGLITGTQWDIMCKFIGWDIADGQIASCSTWGNYYDSTSIISIVWHSDPDDLTYNGWTNSSFSKVSSSISIFATGMYKLSNIVDTSQKNIYDIAGNLWEWTTEVSGISSENRILRGGSVKGRATYDTATRRVGNLKKIYSRWDIGFRIVLYVK
jgi:type II secretory pathway pseudopilin PulG